MYPFESRLEWLLASRYSHLLRALDLARHRHDSLLQERVVSLRRWNRARAIVTLLLSLGFVGTALAVAGNFVPDLARADPLLLAIIKVVGALTGVLTLAYLFLSRLLSQLEADILMLLNSVG